MSLTLLPNLLSPTDTPSQFLPDSVGQTIGNLNGLFAESERGARQFLKLFKKHLPIALINEHTPQNHIDFLLEPLCKGEHWGLISDAGLPLVADPGSFLVLRAYALGIKVAAIPGPSSIMQALMLSGLPGQRFSFHGYLPKEKEERGRELKILEQRSQKEEATQIFIETPYRNLHTLESCLNHLHTRTVFCLAWDLCGSCQGVQTAAIGSWRKECLPNLNSIPAIFLLYKN